MRRRTAAAVAIAIALVAGTARADNGNVLGFSVSAPAAQSSTPVALPSASQPNAPGAINVPAAFTTPPTTAQSL